MLLLIFNKIKMTSNSLYQYSRYTKSFDTTDFISKTRKPTKISIEYHEKTLKNYAVKFNNDEPYNHNLLSLRK